MDISHITQDEWCYIIPMILMAVGWIGLVKAIKKSMEYNPIIRKVEVVSGRLNMVISDLHAWLPEEALAKVEALDDTFEQMYCCEYREYGLIVQCIASSDSDGIVWVRFSKIREVLP